jgi:type VI secretion system Hcp family effector
MSTNPESPTYFTINPPEPSYKVFLDCTDLAGEAIEPEYTNQVNVMRVTTNIRNPVQRSAGNINPVGASQHSGLIIQKFVCPASPVIIEKVSLGAGIADVKLTFVRGTMVKFREINLTGVHITAYEMLDSRAFPGEDRTLPLEQFTLDYGTITDTYEPLDPLGASLGSYSGAYNVLTTSNVVP